MLVKAYFVHALPSAIDLLAHLIKLLPFALLALCARDVWSAPPSITFENKFVIQANERGDNVPDFSYCGYQSGTEPLPQVALRIELKPSGGDDTLAIQQALDRLAAMPIDEQGWRGALVLSPGTFFVSGSLRVYGDHVVLRGSSSDKQSTTIVATGTDRRTLIELGGAGSAQSRSALQLHGLATDPQRLLAKVQSYVPLGSKSFTVRPVKPLVVGQKIVVRHPSTERWISALGMNKMPTDERGSWLDWKPGAYDHLWMRTITKVDGDRIEIDAPLTSALDPELAEAECISAEQLDDTCGSFLGVENLRLISWSDTKTNPKDEQHAWDAIHVDRVTNAWIRCITAQQFVGSAVQVGRHARFVTVSDCLSTEPISENAAWRRQTFLTYGQQSLFLRCKATDGRHDFAIGYLTPGPNVFSYCEATRASHWSGPLGNWSTGALYDNVTMDGGGLALTNRESDAQGAGWAAANCMLWNCVAPQIICRQPPTAFNWAVGVWGEFTGNGYWRSMNEFVGPSSLVHFQLTERVGKDRADQVLAPGTMIAPQPIDVASIQLPSASKDSSAGTQSAASDATRLQIKNGWLTIGDKLAIGSRLTQTWWRGSVIPAKVAEFGPGLLRYVPGIDARNFTDSIVDIADQMQSRHALAIEQHWGLWYDRRRDDHQMIRRASADVWAPFYELPWARSGQGQAWDGLSKYDLTKFNSWYFERLASFANVADERGLVLMYSMYFQHNILEAGAHWADFAWRPANCLQATGFQEPPVYQNRKRVFMAETFYDISHPLRRELHALYIRHCLDVLGQNSNVVFMLSEEFTGPASFVEFWLETISGWEREHNRNVIVVLGATRDVQNAILDKPELASKVDGIDMKYWWYTRDGQLYDPPGANNLAPRQQLREWKGSKSPNAESLARGIRELRQRFPDKAVLCSVGGGDPWLNLSAGASFVDLPSTTEHKLLQQIIACQPQSIGSGNEPVLGALHDKSGERLQVVKGNQPSSQKFSNAIAIDKATGKKKDTAQSANTSNTSEAPENSVQIYWRTN